MRGRPFGVIRGLREGDVTENIQIILIVVVAVVFVVTLLLVLYKGRLKKMKIQATRKGVNIESEMTDDGAAAEKSKLRTEGITQTGNRDSIRLRGEQVDAKNVRQEGDDNTIDIG